LVVSLITPKEMAKENNLKRFIDVQQQDNATAFAEISNGKKRSHWMWYIFPQIRGLGFSETSKYYAIEDMDEAAAYLNHPVLSKRLIDICNALLMLNESNATRIFGPDDMKLRSSITLFSSVPNADPVFKSLLNKFFDGKMDDKTLQITGQQ
jgi:uncharacterized protein (DUF1810 family)